MGVGGQRHASASLSPGKTLYQLYRGLSGPLGWSGRVRKLSPATEIRSPDHPTRSESLYRLSYPGLMYLFGTNNNCLPSLESNTLRIHMYNLMCICRWSQRAHLWSCKNGVPEKCSRWFWLLQPCRYQCVAWGLLEYSAVSLGKWFVLFYCFYRLYLQRSRGSRTATLMGLLNCEDKDNTVLQNNRNHSTGYTAIIPEPGIPNFSRFRTEYLPYKRCSEIRYTLCSKSRLRRKFCLWKTDVQFSEYKARNLNILFDSEGEDFPNIFPQIQDSVLYKDFYLSNRCTTRLLLKY